MLRGVWLELLVIVSLTLANAVFAGAEIAILAVRKTRLQELADEGHGRAKAAMKLRHNPEYFLATVQVGITVLGVTAGAFGGTVLEAPIAASLRGAGIGASADRVALAMVVVLISTLSIVLGELVPKSLALRSAERITLLVSRPLLVLSTLASPVVWFLAKLSNLLLTPFRDSTSFTEARLSGEELQQLVDEAAGSGAVDKETGDIASRAIDLGRLKAFSVMVPRVEITWLQANASRDAVMETLKTRPHARYPVLDEKQEALGYVVAHDVYAQLLDGRLDLQRIARKIPSFPEEVSAMEILRSLQNARSEIGLIVDAHGFPSGLVSIEMLAEELFGEIVNESETVHRSIAPAEPNVFDIRAETQVHEVNRELDLDLPISANASTIGGLVSAAFGRIPTRGACVALADGVDAEVLEASATRIVSVRLRLAKATQ